MTSKATTLCASSVSLIMMENGRLGKNPTTLTEVTERFIGQDGWTVLTEMKAFRWEIIGITYMMNRDICNQHSIIGREMESGKKRT